MNSEYDNLVENDVSIFTDQKFLNVIPIFKAKSDELGNLKSRNVMNQ
jgi:hypothetical protein